MAEQNEKVEVKKEEVKQEEVQATKEEKVEKEVQQEQTHEEKPEGAKEEPKMFTEEEVQKLIQSQADKRVTDALKKAKGKWEKEYKEQLEKEKAEAERLAQMSAEERKAEELRKIQEQIDIERAEFAKQRDDFAKEKLMLKTVKELSEKGIPATFADFLVTGNEEQTHANVQNFIEQWNGNLQSNIETHVNERLKATQQPKVTNSDEVPKMTKQQFARLPYAKRKQMMEEDPDLVKEILNS